MEGKAAASRDADVFDPLALTLGSIYAAAAAPPPPPASPPPPPPPPPAPMVTPRAALRRLNNGIALIRAAAVGAPASPPPPLTVVTPRRINNGKAVMYAAAAPSSPPPPPPPPVALRATYRRRLNPVPAPIHVPTAPPSPPPPPPPSPVAPRATHGHHHRVNDDAATIDVDLLLQVPPFPWATERPAQHCTLLSLLRRGVTSVVGHARCKRCAAWKAIAYDLEPKFWELRDYIVANRHAMDDRAPRAWEYPALPDCGSCGHKSAMWPEIAANKLQINWLFLFLGQMLGCCTLEQLKYFCMNNGQHRTGAKNRVLYYAYLEMSSQLLSFE